MLLSGCADLGTCTRCSSECQTFSSSAGTKHFIEKTPGRGAGHRNHWKGLMVYCGNWSGSGRSRFERRNMPSNLWMVFSYS